MGTLAKALELAATAHKGQTDKGGFPYICHPLRMVVAALDGDYGDDVAIVATLHDVVEDTTVTLSALSMLHGFQAHIVEAVDALTRRKGESYFDALSRAKANPLARAVKLLDNADNSHWWRIDRVDDEASQERLRAKYEEARNYLMA